MTSYIGEGFLLAATLLCVIHFIKDIKHVGLIIFGLISLSFAAFLFAHVSDDFSMLNVVMHSHSSKPLLYKIAGTWASHEGSMLFWCLLLSGYSVIAKVFEKDAIIWKTQENLFVLLLFGFLLFTYITNPFTRLAMPLHQGMDLNPVLQDISLAIHPPHLYLGTVGFALPFVQALSFLKHKVSPKVAGKILFPTMLIAFFFQTVGILLGAVWAYYELGWGGWWFFDPVENLALLPWLGALITLHLIILARKNESLYGWAIAGCLKTFGICLIALTLIRAGMLNSVHAFGADPEKGFLLGSLAAFWYITAFVFYFKFYGSLSISLTLKKPTLENITFGGMSFLWLAALALAIGTFIPVVADAIGHSIIIGNSFFIQSFAVTFAGAGLCLLLVMSVFNKNKTRWLAKNFAHLGAFIATVGIIFSSLMGSEKEFLISQKQSITFKKHPITLEEFEVIQGPNYKAARATIHVAGQRAFPEERFYHTQNVLHRETSIVTLNYLHQMHLTIGDVGIGEKTAKTKCTLKVIYKPWINIMWAGFAWLALGILWSVVSNLRLKFKR